MSTEKDTTEGGLEEALVRLWEGIRTPPDGDLDSFASSATVDERDVVPRIGLRPRVLRPRWALALAGLALLVGSGLGFGLGSSLTPTGQAAAQGVTMGFVRLYDPGCACYKARVFGSVSNGKADEYVVVLEEFCGRDSGRSIVAATTRAGGAWQAEIDIVPRPDSDTAVSYRARWNDELSEPVTFRGRLSVAGKKLRTGRQLVTVGTPQVNPVNMKGRQIVLQRQVAGRWTRVASARLAPHRTRFYTFTATFSVPRRGWKVRALVPSKAAAPCFSAQPSVPWVS
jgi:hypothetical protein